MIFKYTNLRAKFNGWLDGRRGIPTANQLEPPPYLREIIAVCKEEISRIGQAWLRDDKTLFSDWIVAKQNLEQARSNCPGGSSAIATDSRAISGLTYWSLALVISAGELYLNSKIFQIYGVSRTEALILSSILALVITVVAFFVGHALKARRYKIGVAISLLTIAISFLGMAIIRVWHFQAIKVAELFGITINPITLYIIFFSLNSLFLLAEVIVAFLRAPSEPELEKKQKELERRRLRVEYWERKFHELGSRRRKQWERSREEAFEKMKQLNRLAAAYMASNLRARVKKYGNEIPKCFKEELMDKYLSIELPESIEILSWDQPASQGVLPALVTENLMEVDKRWQRGKN